MIKSHDTTTLLNQADFGTLIAQSTSGNTWQLLSYTSPILPVHAALLPPTGNGPSTILLFCGSGNSNNLSPQPGVVTYRGCPNCSAVWDYVNGTITQVVTPVDGAGLPLDLFCSGQSLLPDGRVLAAGGTLAYNDNGQNWLGLQDSFIFDRNTRQWTLGPSMDGGRWYPTQVTLSDGTVVAFSGFDEVGSNCAQGGQGGCLNVFPEIYSPTANSWTVVTPGIQTQTALPLYPHVFLLRDGRLFYSGAYMGDNANETPRILTLPPAPSTQQIGEQPVGGLPTPYPGNQAASVLLPPADQQRVMIIGGGDANGNATSNCYIAQFSTASQTVSNPTYKAAAALHNPRMHHYAVLLPDRTVFVCNGGKVSEDTNQTNLPAEIYNPATNTWTQVATPSVQRRVYHSLALLLPDGRVATAGGNPNRDDNELRLEIYSPSYMSQSRPVIQSVSKTTLTYGNTFTIQTPQASNIKWVHLIRPMAPTHSCDTEQRLVNLTIKSRTTTALTVTLTSNRNLAPPGWYMLFIANQSGIPSVATWMQIT